MQRIRGSGHKGHSRDVYLKQGGKDKSRTAHARLIAERSIGGMDCQESGICHPPQNLSP